MSVDRTLTTVLGLYQDVHDDAKTEQIYATTTSLLTHLSNPLNLSLLTSQLLNSPAIWRRPNRMRTCYRIISIFNTAAIHVRRNEVDNSRHRGPRVGGGLSSEAWTRAIAKGADDRSPRWKHLLVLTGILMGMEGNGRQSLPSSLRNTLEHAVVTATNLALGSDAEEGLAGTGAVVLALNYAFPLLSDLSQASLDHDLLLPCASRALLGEAGLNSGLFLNAVNNDVVQYGHIFDWPTASPSFLQLQHLDQQPLISGMGPLSRLLAYGIEHARDSRVVLQIQDDLVVFTKNLFEQWQANKLGGLEVSEEAAFLTPETRETTWPALWQFLKKVMYAVVAVLHRIVSRSLLDHRLRSDAVAPSIATKSLHVLRNLCFVSSYHGNNAFQVYTFTYLASIDILTQYPAACNALLQEIKPPSPGVIPAHPLLRTLDLFYLNLAEHLPLSLPSWEACDALIVQPATTYLSHSAALSARMVELFESAHSAVLSALSCPDNAPLTVQLAPFYADTLLKSFPSHISPRQFRLAFKTMMQILSPPFPISATHPGLAETFLEMVRFRISSANPAPLPPRPDAQGQSDMSSPSSEQSTLVMTLIDSLPFLHLSIFEEWMMLAAEALHEIPEPAMREAAKRRFWEILVNGEMDVERSAIGVAWWGTKGGRELVLSGRSGGSGGSGPDSEHRFLMSGAILEGATGSKL